MTRRKPEPDARVLLQFVAEHESLALTTEEFPDLSEERIRALLLSLATVGERPTANDFRPPTAVRAQAIGASGQVNGRAARRVILNTDGTARGNPGPAGAGWIIATANGEVLRRGGAFLGQRTSNEAEYEAVIRGIVEALDLGADEVALRSDSELLIKQVNGEFQVRNERIADLHHKARALMGRLRRIDAKHVPRAQNADADAMANAAIDQAPAR